MQYTMSLRKIQYAIYNMQYCIYCILYIYIAIVYIEINNTIYNTINRTALPRQPPPSLYLCHFQYIMLVFLLLTFVHPSFFFINRFHSDLLHSANISCNTPTANTHITMIRRISMQFLFYRTTIKTIKLQDLSEYSDFDFEPLYINHQVGIQTIDLRELGE